MFNRILLIVLDGAGIGAMPDAAEWGDAIRYFGHILESQVRLPNLQRYGLGNVRPLPSPAIEHPIGSYGRCALRQMAKTRPPDIGRWPE